MQHLLGVLNAFKDIVNDLETEKTDPEGIKEEIRSIKNVANQALDTSAKSFLQVADATIRFHVSRQALWTKLAGRLTQVENALQIAHKHADQEDLKEQFDVEMKHVGELKGLLSIEDDYNNFKGLDHCKHPDTTGDLFAVAEYTSRDNRINLEQAEELVLTRYDHVQKMRDILNRQEMAEEKKTELGKRVLDVFIGHLKRDADFDPETDKINWET